MRIQKYKHQDEDQEKQIDDYVLKVKKELEKKEAQKAKRDHNQRSRNWFGLRLGVLVGLGFGLTAELLNVYILPDIWIHSPPFGALGNFLFYGFLGGSISLILSRPADTFSGVSLGVLAGLGAIEVRSWLIPGATPIVRMIFEPSVFLYALVSLAFVGLLLIPVMMFWRFCIDTQFELQNNPWWTWRRFRSAFMIVAFGGIVGSFFIHSSDTRLIFIDMDNLVKTGLAATNENQLPNVYSTESTKKILEIEDELYYLEIYIPISPDNESSTRSVFGSSGLGGNISIAAVFKGGWTLVCTYQSPRIQPYCRGRDG